ncbi:MAG: FAD-dependent thymidylate synthase [bacterium]
MAHVVVPEAEAILDKEFKVLDRGFIRLVDYFGGDKRIVQAARVSYGPGTKTVREDELLIDYLMQHMHTSPFEQVVLTFHAKMPIFVARQWVRHRTARINEISGRYSVMQNEFYVPAEEDIRFQSKRDRQGRSREEVPPELRQKVLDILTRTHEQAYKDYEGMIEDGLARELARISLPITLYTEWYWQIDLHNLFHFLKLRLDWHAQKEIRAYAEVMAQIAKTIAPMAYKAFEEHNLHSVRFSRSQANRLREALAETNPGLLKELGLDEG